MARKRGDVFLRGVDTPMHTMSKSTKMLSLHYHELMGKIEEHEKKKYLMVDDYMKKLKK